MSPGKNWNQVPLPRQGRELRIEVAPRSSNSELTYISIFLLIAVGIISLFVQVIVRTASLSQSLTSLMLASVLELVAFFIFRELLESKCATQLVTVDGRELRWIRRTRFWTRKGLIPLSAITEVVAQQTSGGVAHVFATEGRQRHLILRELVATEAARFAREIRRYL